MSGWTGTGVTGLDETGAATWGGVAGERSAAIGALPEPLSQKAAAPAAPSNSRPIKTISAGRGAGLLTGGGVGRGGAVVGKA